MARSRVIGIGKAVVRNKRAVVWMALALLVFGPLLRGAGVEGFALNLIGLGFAGLVVRGVLVKRMQLREQEAFQLQLRRREEEAHDRWLKRMEREGWPDEEGVAGLRYADG